MVLQVTQNAYFSLTTHTKQLLLVTFGDTTRGIDREMADGQTDVNIKIVIYIAVLKSVL